MPSDRRPPIVPDDDGLLLAQGMNDADDVGREVQDVIRLDRFRRVRLPIPALIRRDRLVASLGKRCHLMPPGVPGFRPARQRTTTAPSPCSARSMRMPLESMKLRWTGCTETSECKRRAVCVAGPFRRLP